MSFFRNINAFSFWIGFLLGALFWWLVSTIRAYLPRLREMAQERFRSIRDNITASTESRLRADMLRLAQRQHLAAPMFALDEILILPRMIANPATITEPGKEIAPTDIVSLTIPYLPDYPELATNFGGAALTLVQALEGDANLVLIGQPGIGKTVALAHLTTLIARNDPDAGSLQNLLPLYVHVADLPLTSLNPKTPLGAILNAISERVSALTLARLPELIETVFVNGRVILLLDGLDELSNEAIRQYVVYLSALLHNYPRVRMVVAASTEYYDGLTALGLIPIAMATWDKHQRKEFVEKWGQLWTHLVVPDYDIRPEEVDPLLLNGWLQSRDLSLSPLELTLKVWAAYAGDALGPDGHHAIEAYLRRLTVANPKARPALEQLAFQMAMTLNSCINNWEAENWTAVYEQPEGENQALIQDLGAPGSDRKRTQKTSSRLMPELFSHGILVPRLGSRLNFNHSVIFGYLTGCALSKSGGNLGGMQNQSDWVGKSLAFGYLACFQDISNLIDPILAVLRDDPIRRGPLAAARWLRNAPKNAPWRGSIMRFLANTIQKEHLTLGLSARAMVALAGAGDPNVSPLFRQLLRSDQANLRTLGALGCGLLLDQKSVDDLAELTVDEDPIVGRAALIALAVIGGKTAMDNITATLLQGNEIMRRAAAEVLATIPGEGHSTLKDGSEMSDLLVRRAVVYGLVRVNQPWSTELLEKIQIEDGQWVVRNAATEALEEYHRPKSFIPRRIPSLQDAPWLIAFAAKQGIGVGSGHAAIELLLQVLKDGTEDQRLAALEYIRLKGNDEEVVQVYHTLYGNLGELREAAYNTLWHLAASGVKLPSPIQFGL